MLNPCNILKLFNAKVKAYHKYRISNVTEIEQQVCNELFEHFQSLLLTKVDCYETLEIIENDESDITDENDYAIDVDNNKSDLDSDSESEIESEADSLDNLDKKSQLAFTSVTFNDAAQIVKHYNSTTTTKTRDWSSMGNRFRALKQVPESNKNKFTGRLSQRVNSGGNRNDKLKMIKEFVIKQFKIARNSHFAVHDRFTIMGN